MPNKRLEELLERALKRADEEEENKELVKRLKDHSVFGGKVEPQRKPSGELEDVRPIGTRARRVEEVFREAIREGQSEHIKALYDEQDLTIAEILERLDTVTDIEERKVLIELLKNYAS